MNALKRGRPTGRINQHEKTLAKDSIRRTRDDLLTIHPEQPRASSLINDSYSVKVLQTGLLTGSKQLASGKTMNYQLPKTLVNSFIVNPVVTAPGPSQKKDVSPCVSGYQEAKLKYVKDVFCVNQFFFLTNVPTVESNLPVGARLQNFWQIWLDLGAGPKVVQILKEGYTLPFRTWPNLTRSPTIISCYVNPHRNLYLLEALHQLMSKNAVKLVQNQIFWASSTNFSWF